MLKYVAKRVLLALVTIFVVVAITFFTMNAIPGGPFTKEKAPSKAVQAVLEKRFHLDKPVGQQFFLYLTNLSKGDMGISLKTGREISDVILTALGTSVKLGSRSIALALSLGLILGITAAVYRNRWPDRLIIFLTTFFVSVPSFVLATLLLYFFSLHLGWFPVWSANDPSFVLPVISLSMYPMAYITRLTKSSMLDVLGEDYVRTARAKGVIRRRILTKHALRNAILPVITYLGPMIAFILTGSMVVETVYTMGGMGREFVLSIQNRDYTLITGFTIFLATLMILMNLVSDLVYKLVDPRIRFD